MGDTLKYRIPGSLEQQSYGCFEERDSFEGVEGFVIASFTKDKRYAFVEGEVEASLSFSSNKPKVDSHESYKHKGNQLLNVLQFGKAEKAILSRIHRAAIDVNPNQLFEALCRAYPKAFVYLVSSPLFGTWVGATPEVLVAGTKDRSETFALAGTKISQEHWSEKEYDEQQIVARYIAEVLNASAVENVEVSPVKTVGAGPVEHLITEYTFSQGQVSTLSLAESLHPTPAVSGLPVASALELIESIETHDRSLYAGFIGCVGERSDLFVNLRCAQLFEDECYLYLGGGYTKNSKVEKEWIETENKARTLLDVLENL